MNYIELVWCVKQHYISKNGIDLSHKSFKLLQKYDFSKSLPFLTGKNLALLEEKSRLRFDKKKICAVSLDKYTPQILHRIKIR